MAGKTHISDETRTKIHDDLLELVKGGLSLNRAGEKIRAKHNVSVRWIRKYMPTLIDEAHKAGAGYKYHEPEKAKRPAHGTAPPGTTTQANKVYYKSEESRAAEEEDDDKVIRKGIWTFLSKLAPDAWYVYEALISTEFKPGEPGFEGNFLEYLNVAGAKLLDVAGWNIAVIPKTALQTLQVLNELDLKPEHFKLLAKIKEEYDARLAGETRANTGGNTEGEGEVGEGVAENAGGGAVA